MKGPKPVITEDEAIAAAKTVTAFLGRDESVNHSTARKAQATIAAFIRQREANNRATAKRLGFKNTDAARAELRKFLLDELDEKGGV